MKRFFVILFLACTGIFYPAKANAHISATPIDFKGGLTLPPGSVRTPVLPIEAYLNASGVDVLFNSDLGSLKVVVTHPTDGIIFQKMVYATAGSTLTINTSGWESGEYTLRFTDAQGDYLEGVFLID